MGAIADPGDEVIVFEPFYTNYNGFAAMTGVHCVPVTTKGEDGYHLPARAAILICSPNNPTGTVYTEAELETLLAICRDRGLYLIADEVYREFTYDGKSSRSLLTFSGLEQQVIVVDSVSKRYSLCGARIGNIVSRNKPFMDAILRFGQARLCPPTVEQFACCALTEVPASYTRGVIAEYQKRRDVVFDALSTMPGVRVRKPEGAFYLCLGLPVDDANAFATFLLREFSLNGETVMVAPLDGFYATPGLGRDEVRLAYVLECDKLERSMRILAAARALAPAPD
jgi:aspartate aminotransferase